MSLYNYVRIAYTGPQFQLGITYVLLEKLPQTITEIRGFVEMRQFKVIVEKHPDGYVAYPLGLKGVVVGEGDTYEEALADVKSAIRCHIETFGQEVLEADSPVLEAFVAEAGVAI
jgi:predicted RNase H-like HicB family nuclease